MDIFQSISDTIGIPEDQIRLVFGFLITIPFGFVFKNIQGRQTRLNVGTVYGLLLTLLVYQEKIISVILQTVISYYLTKIYKEKAPKIVFIETLLFVSIHHIYRQITDYGGWFYIFIYIIHRKMDVTTVLMMDTPRWTSFAYCYADGFKKDDQLSKDQSIRKITKLPSFSEYFSYVFFYASALAGPAYDYYDFNEFINLEGTYKNIPSTGLQTAKKFRNAVICAVINVALGAYLPLDYIITEDFAQLNFFFKSVYFNICLTVFRTKYLTGWCFAEACITACGLSYNGDNKWDRIVQINLKVDLLHNPREKVEYWNISIQQWLKRYVYLRVYDENELKSSLNKQNNAQYVTYFVSAFWHGFYPAYYLSFFQFGIMNTTCKFIYKMSINTPYFKIFETNIFLKALRFYCANTMWNCFGCGFMLLSIEKNYLFYNSIYWSYSIINIVMFSFFVVTGFGQKGKKKVQ